MRFLLLSKQRPTSLRTKRYTANSKTHYQRLMLCTIAKNNGNRTDKNSNKNSIIYNFENTVANILTPHSPPPKTEKTFSSAAKQTADTNTTAEQRFTMVETVADARSALAKLMALGTDRLFAVDTETVGVDPRWQSPVGNALLISASIYCGPDADFGAGPHLWIDNANEHLALEFREFFEDAARRKLFHNFSFDRHVLENLGLELRGFAGDTMHMARLLDSDRMRYSLDALSQVYLKRRKTPFKQLFHSDLGLEPESKSRHEGKISAQNGEIIDEKKKNSDDNREKIQISTKICKFSLEIGEISAENGKTMSENCEINTEKNNIKFTKNIKNDLDVSKNGQNRHNSSKNSKNVPISAEKSLSKNNPISAKKDNESIKNYQNDQLFSKNDKTSPKNDKYAQMSPKTDKKHPKQLGRPKTPKKESRTSDPEQSDDEGHENPLRLQSSSATRSAWVDYCTYDAEATWLLYHRLAAELRRQPWDEGRSMLDFYEAYYVPFGELLTRMEREGMHADAEALGRAYERALGDLARPLVAFRRWAVELQPAARLMNPRSVRQVQQLLFAPSTEGDDPYGTGLPAVHAFKAKNVAGEVKEGKKKANKFLEFEIRVFLRL